MLNITNRPGRGRRSKIILPIANKGEVKLPVNNVNDGDEANTQRKTIKTKMSAHRMRYIPKFWYLRHPFQEKQSIKHQKTNLCTCEKICNLKISVNSY